MTAEHAFFNPGRQHHAAAERSPTDMQLMPWRRQTPYITPLSTLQQEMNRMFEEAFGPSSRFSEYSVSPALDIKEDENTVTVTAELPGVDKKDVQIEVRDNVLTIKGEKRSEQREEKDNWHCVERSYGSFARRVVLPSQVDDNQAEATMENGVLTLKMAKAQANTGKTIEVK
jgi:HSP20 family protein